MITIYSKPACPNCDIAIRLSSRLKEVEINTLKLDADYTLEDLFKATDEAGVARPRQFPVIFFHNEYIGSLDEFKQGIIAGKFYE